MKGKKGNGLFRSSKKRGLFKKYAQLKVVEGGGERVLARGSAAGGGTP